MKRDRTMTYIALAAAGAAGYYLFFRKPAAPTDPTVTITIPGFSGSGQIKLSQACSQARALKAAGNPDWQVWANVCTSNGGTV
jgi:hypothetical protein